MTGAAVRPEDIRSDIVSEFIAATRFNRLLLCQRAPLSFQAMERLAESKTR